MWELWIKFYLGQNEDCSWGEWSSESSERLLQRGSGGRWIYKILVKGEFNAIKYLLYERFSASHKELMSPWRDLVLFQIWRDARTGIMKSVPENVYLQTCSTSFPGAQSASLSTLNSPQGVLKVGSCSGTGFTLQRGRWQVPLLLLFNHW